MYLTRSAEAPARARAFVRQMLVSTPAGVVETTELLVSELVTNAVRHTTAARIRVDVTPQATCIRVSVHDPVPGLDRSDGPPSPGPGGGFGLGIVEELATRWGVDDIESGKSVWFEIAP